MSMELTPGQALLCLSGGPPQLSLARSHAPLDFPLALAYLAASNEEEAARELLEDLAQRARDGEWDPLRQEEEQWRLAGCYYFALRCLAYFCSSPSASVLMSLTQHIDDLGSHTKMLAQNRYVDPKRLLHGESMSSVVQRLQDLIESPAFDHIR